MIRLIKLFIWIVLIFGAIIYFKYSHFVSAPLEKSLSVTIEEWDSFYKVFEKIYPEKNIYVKIFFRNNPEKINFKLPTGTYTFYRDDTIEKILEKLEKWTVLAQISLTNLPWWNIFDIDQYLSQKSLIEAWDFIKEARNIEKYKDKYLFLEQALSLEGFLYPDTHFVLKDNFSLESYMHLLLKNFERKIYTPLLSEYSWKEIIDTINMASIIEREERNVSEKSTVAGILLKRLKERWYIGADITVCYPYELTEKECTPAFINSKVSIDKNDYNTRTKLWLPKTPINNPQITSIQAVISPKETPYYYYLHNIQTGKIYYARTNDEHNRNKALYLK